MVSRNSGRKLDTDEPKNGKTTIKFSTRVLSQAPNDLITAASSWDSRPLTIIALHPHSDSGSGLKDYVEWRFRRPAHG
jgi:hypothetical protein